MTITYSKLNIYYSMPPPLGVLSATRGMVRLVHLIQALRVQTDTEYKYRCNMFQSLRARCYNEPQEQRLHRMDGHRMMMMMTDDIRPKLAQSS